MIAAGRREKIPEDDFGPRDMGPELASPKAWTVRSFAGSEER